MITSRKGKVVFLMIRMVNVKHTLNSNNFVIEKRKKETGKLELISL